MGQRRQHSTATWSECTGESFISSWSAGQRRQHSTATWSKCAGTAFISSWQAVGQRRQHSTSAWSECSSTALANPSYLPGSQQSQWDSDASIIQQLGVNAPVQPLYYLGSQWDSNASILQQLGTTYMCFWQSVGQRRQHSKPSVPILCRHNLHVLLAVSGTAMPAMNRLTHIEENCLGDPLVSSPVAVSKISPILAAAVLNTIFHQWNYTHNNHKEVVPSI